MLTCLQGDCPQLFYLLHIKRSLQTTVVLGHITGRTLEEGGTSEALIQREQPLKLVEKDPGDDFGFGNSGNGCGSGLELQVPGRPPR